MAKRELGVIIARFQAPRLTDAHQYLLTQVATRVNRVLVLLGTAAVPCLKKNPIEYSIRMRMLEEWWQHAYPTSPELTILPLIDCPTDEEWAARVDQLIAAINVNGDAKIFFGPDGAGPAYSLGGGRWPVEMLDSMGGHASKVREALTPRYTEDFRAGIIYGIERAFTNPRPTIDVVIREGDKLLLGHKAMDRRKDGREWRLVGGFVDVNDGSLEAAVRREVLEETGLEVSEPIYVGSAPVEDWRYRQGPESILTSVFSCQKVFGEPKAADDIDALKWFTRAEAEKVIHPIHGHLLHLGLRVQ
jgi:bifunctional NMN adenylyltransferase/nudix hydrolase